MSEPNTDHEIAESEAPAENAGQSLNTPGFVLGVSVIGLSVLTGFYMGKHDIIAALLVVIVAYLIFMRVYDLRMGIRNVAKDLFQPGSTPHNWLSKQKSALQLGAALFFSVSLAVGFAVVLRSLHEIHSAFVIYPLLTAACIYLGFFRNKDLVTDSLSESMGSEDNKKLVQSLIRIGYSFVVLNLILVFILSAYDVHLFYSEPYLFNEYQEKAHERGIQFNGDNKVSRVFVNLGVVLDTVRSAAVNESLKELDFERNVSAFFVFYLLIGVLNFIKFSPLSLGVVLIYFSIRVRYLERLQKLFGIITAKAFAAWRLVKSLRKRKQIEEKNDAS
ncbi:MULTISPECIES: hypothetical protein [Halomonadaceae]|uniref:Uncharacterized protein n=1 Tax=Vreelandella halophila TaxID=86177 RepID=A0A9X4YED5_9GAMM|nr:MULTISPECIES: hypothetical protein [Halomonas]MYL28161.1 hypothetical protein [Halomonas utahensis]MYL76068.1 hypothetical protein [Halomonas sp. 22501_18_FS]